MKKKAIRVTAVLLAVILLLSCLAPENKRVEAAENLAYGRTVTVSSEESDVYGKENAVDADGETRWSSLPADEQYLIVDLWEPHTVSSVKIAWEAAYASQYQIQVSNDNNSWDTVYENYNSAGGTQTVRFNAVSARYVKLYCIKRATEYGFSVFEFEIYSEDITDSGTAKQAKDNVLSYLYSIKGKQTVIGMHNREPNTEPSRQTDRAYSVTGEYPALWSGDFLFSSSDVDNRWNMIYECVRQWESGSLVQLMLHVTSPLLPDKGEWDGGVVSSLTNEQWQSLITDGEELNRAWKERLDTYAVYLRYLKENGVPVLFRPFHEMNQSMFWWAGRKGENGTTALYRLTRDYLEKEKGLDNLIWVWDMQDLSYDWSEYNPGSDYWDIFAVDIYNSDRYTAYKYEQAKAAAKDKLIAVGECDRLPSPDELKAQPEWCFVMSWAELTFSYNTENEIRDLYNADNVIVRRELPDLKAKDDTTEETSSKEPESTTPVYTEESATTKPEETESPAESAAQGLNESESPAETVTGTPAETEQQSESATQESAETETSAEAVTPNPQETEFPSQPSTPGSSVTVTVNGYQISAVAEGFRTLYTVDDPDNEVEEAGMIYAIAGKASPDELVADAIKESVKSFKATDAGLLDVSTSDSVSSDTYCMTVGFLKPATAAYVNTGWYVRAYVKLKNGGYIYSGVNSFSLYQIADYLYQNLKMNNSKSHDFLYNSMLSVADPEYRKRDFDWNNSVVKPEFFR